MSNLLVPHDVSSAGADVWLGSIDEPSFDGFLTYGAGTATIDAGGWTEWRCGGHIRGT